MTPYLVNNNYLILREFIPKERAVSLAAEFREHSKSITHRDEQAPSSPAIYNHISFLELLCEVTPKVSEAVGTVVLPTYSYARVYTNGEILARHRDRPSCEISLTLHLSGDDAWPIYIQGANQTEVGVELSPGDAMIYLGCVADHWRDKFAGSWYAQVFLHYVNSRGNCANYYFDRQSNERR
ncbi:MAG: hypothetical protein EBU08_18755 [Micrococcales bacterium]|nr:hypothetical protein [Micrococcales bacterium]